MPKPGRQNKGKGWSKGDWRIFGSIVAPGVGDEGDGHRSFCSMPSRSRGVHDKRRASLGGLLRGCGRREVPPSPCPAPSSVLLARKGKKAAVIVWGSVREDPFGRCEELEKTLALVGSGRSLEWCWTGPVERSAVPPLQLPLLLNSLRSVEEAVRVHPSPGPGPSADWTLAARDKDAVGGRRALPSNHQLPGLAASG